MPCAVCGRASRASQTPPPAPALIQAAAGAALVQPIAIEWGAIDDPDGPIGSYTWPVSPTSTFGIVVASGFTNASGDAAIPTSTQDRISGLPNGT